MKLLALLLLAVSAHADPIRVRVYHTNDVHGWIMARPDKFQTDRMIGGAAALASLLGKDSGPKLLLDAGDWWQGTPEGSLTKGAAVADVFNALGYDAVTIGNHEYDDGQASLRDLIGRMKMPVLSANTYEAGGKRVPWATPWIVKEVAGVKIGIFGLTTPHMRRLARAENIAGLEWREETSAARDAVKALRKEGATVIIAVTHLGIRGPTPDYQGDERLLAEVDGIDLIVGGHTHTFLKVPVRGAKGALAVQAGQYLLAVGRSTLEIDPKTKKVVAASDELIDLWVDKVGEDAAVKAIVAGHTDAVGKIFETVVATSTALMGREPEKESAVGDWMTDCFRESLHTETALINGGGIRAEIPAGPVTLRTIFNVMPFDNYMVKLTVKGSALRALFDYGVGMGKIMQVSGAEIDYRRPAPSGERLLAVKVGGAPLEDERVYSITTMDFLINGGGFSFDRFVSSEPATALARDLMGDCARRQGTIAPPPLGRLKQKED